ncbi:MAG: recombination protein RecR [Kiritimatiellia bacterium]|jgi:recombination protein RecR
MTFDHLVRTLSKLPGIGRRSAERIGYKLVLHDNQLLNELQNALAQAGTSICCCSSCGKITEKTQDPCRLCSDASRDNTLLCIVEEPGDIQLVESSGGFKGRYFCLQGKLSPMQGETVGSQRLLQLKDRMQRWGTKEVILAMNGDVESDATAQYLHEILSDAGVQVTRLASGIPAGSGLGYTDPITLSRAIKGRQTL